MRIILDLILSNYFECVAVASRMTPISDDVKQLLVLHRPAVYTLNMGKTNGSFIGIKLRLNLASRQGESGFEEGPLSRIVDEADWTIAITA